MGGIDIETSGRKRPLNTDLQLVPYIDMLMVTVAFLLITAVWSTNGRLNADAQIPGNTDEIPISPPDRTLHVYVHDEEFSLVWKDGATVMSETRLPKREVRLGQSEQPTYPDLARALRKEWEAQGSHRDRSDRKLDQAVLHTPDRMAYGEIAGVLDAILHTKREMAFPGGETEQVAAFNMVFAMR